jgi:formylglycine-generating enzyme
MCAAALAACGGKTLDTNAAVNDGAGGSAAAGLGAGGTATAGPSTAGGAQAGGAGSASRVSAADARPFVPASPSCAGGLTCNGESCCTSISVPGGTFLQGRATEDCGALGCQSTSGNQGCPNGGWCKPDEQPEHPSTVSSFALDKYEVTIGRFRNFVAAYEAGWRPAVGSGASPNVAVGDTSWRVEWDSTGVTVPLPKPGTFTDASHLNCGGWQTWTDSPGTAAQESRAINCVNWYEAFAFCIWDGARLPTESEWEYVAAGGSDNRLYPWGSAPPDCTYANFANGATFCGPGGNEAVAAVGSYAAGKGLWGHADMAGNVAEWVFDWQADYSALPTNDYADTTWNHSRVVRGGNCENEAPVLRTAFRDESQPADRDYARIGLRCARSAP